MKFHAVKKVTAVVQLQSNCAILKNKQIFTNNYEFIESNVRRQPMITNPSNEARKMIPQN
jgi:hypothetical protein